MNRRVKADDVARAAGVSKTTLSHALSGKGRMRDETRERVVRVAGEMGYVPDQRSLALKTGQSGVLAFVTGLAPEFGQGLGFQYVAEFAGAAAQSALAAGRVLALVPSVGRVEWMSKLPLDGAILTDPAMNDPILQALRTQWVPYVTVGPEPGRSPEEQWWVSVDEHKATQLGLDHLYARGARSIALVVSEEERWYARTSRSTYESWAAAHAMRAQVCLVQESSAAAGAKAAIIDLLAREPAIDGAYAPENVFGAGVLDGALAAGREVPREFRLVTMDSPWAVAVEPHLTCVDTLLADTAREAVRLLVGRIAEPTAPAESTVLNPQLIVRGSS